MRTSNRKRRKVTSSDNTREPYYLCVADYWYADCSRRATKSASCETLSSKRGGYSWSQGTWGGQPVPSSALDALVSWRRWAAMQRENFELMKSGEGDG